MAVRYVGGKPTRITCYTERKNTNRWMHEAKPKLNIPDGEYVFYTIIEIITIPVIIWFVAMCFR